MIRRMLRALMSQDRSVVLSGLAIDRTTYAIGDIHGRADLLDRMIDLIQSDEAQHGEGPISVIFLGDYIDRGYQSRQVLERLSELPEATGWDVRFLRGNHEALLQAFFDDPVQAAPRWFRNGGLETLLSYEVGGASATTHETVLVEIRDRLAEKIAPVLPWLSQLLPCYQTGNVFFGHAGADPAWPLDRQPEHALLWGVPSFLDTPRTDSTWVVHGHYITDAPVLTPTRIGIDTGAYYSGRLTAARIATGSVTFLTT